MQMKMNWQKVLGGIALASALAGASATASADYEAWDTDGDGFIEYSEWDAGYDYDPLYTTWDTDGDGMLTDDEWGTGLYNSYDADNDGVWSEEENAHFMDDAGEEGWLDM
ncbi:hypothetical protein [Halopseudomonas sp.]|jgi:hypothetical protein|uniref:hypothetical protein n=1 Tax=Halopseudomonas sp. TaxID=2901191 RepID=UPI00300325FD|tara:strand:+ start:7601 stop:7930 length:330 start_codon:yes stop_codon:yes gene_type:complete